MRPFGYAVATSVQDAVERVSADRDAVFLGGGTNLVDLMRLGVARPAHLVDVTHLGLDGVSESVDGGLLLGAGTANSDLAADPRVRRDYPVLSQALLAGASGQLRNAATVGGNLLQRTRCVYFQDVTKPCNKRSPGSGCPGREGANRDLAVLGTDEHCVATYPGDMAVALAALDARVQVTGPAGARTLSLDELYRSPGSDPSQDTTLAHGELITGVELPAPDQDSRTSRYRKTRDRASYAFALVSAGVSLGVRDGRLGTVRIALGSVAPRPWRARTAEAALTGAELGDSLPAAVTQAMREELSQARPLSGNAFKPDLAVRLVTAVVTDLLENRSAA